MPGNYEYKDIRTLLNREKSYLDQNRQFEKKEADLKNQIRELLNNDTGKNISADFIRNEAVFHHGNVFYHTDSVNELLKLVYRYVLLYDAKKNAEKTRTHLERIKDALAKASIASNFIRWTMKEGIPFRTFQRAGGRCEPVPNGWVTASGVCPVKVNSE